MDPRQLPSRLRSNPRLVVIAVICLVLVASVGAASVFWAGGDEDGDDRPLDAVIWTDASSAHVHEDITFSANGSSGDIVLCMWDFGEGDVVLGMNATRAFPASRYYNVYLTVTDTEGDVDIAMVNISVHNRNDQVEETGLFLDSTARRGPSHDWADLDIHGGLTRPTVYVNFTGTTECAVLYLSAYLPDQYYSDTVVCAGNDLDVRLVFEDVEMEGDHWADMYIECERGYITDYCLQMAVVY